MRRPHPQADKLETCCRLYVEGLTSKPQQLSELVLSLDEAYSKFLATQGEIDERDFLLHDFGGLASPRTLPGADNAAAAALPHQAAAAAAAAAGGPGTLSSLAQAATHAAAAAAAGAGSSSASHSHPAQQQHPAKPPLAPPAAANAAAAAAARRPLSIGLQSPLPLMQLGHPGPATPISQAMGSVAWLKNTVKELALQPPGTVQRIMDAAGADAGRILSERVAAAAAAVFLGGGVGAAAGAGSRLGFPELQQGVAQERRDEGIKIYWHVLDTMLRAEEARAGLPAACSLLTRWPFHQCLLACCFELVAAAYRMGLLSFPAIPGKLGLKPFDLSKMIGPFVKAVPSLPRELKRHMFTVEEKILESLGWAPGSSFYRLARAAAGQQQQQGAAEPAASGGSAGGDAAASAEQQDANMAEGAAPAAAADKQQAEDTDEKQQQQAAGSRKRATPGSEAAAAAAADSRGSPAPMEQDSSAAAAADATNIDLVPKRQRAADGGVASHPHAAEAFAPAEPEHPLPRAIGAPGSPLPPGGDASARAVLHDHCRKLLKLAAFRLVAVSHGLDFTPMEGEEVLAAVHEVLGHALYCHTHLFYGRHLDTLLLASLYGYCKVNRLHQITFREIISHYKRQAHARQEAFRSVALQRTDPGLVTQATGDIIAFYNAVFVPVMKGFLLTTVQQPAISGNGSNGTRSGRQNSGELPAASDAAAAQPAGSQSPIFTALMHAAQQQQQQQQQGWGGGSGGGAPAVAAGGGTSSTYRALSLVGGGGGVEGLGFNGAGGSGLSSLSGFGGSAGLAD
ncbi:hypothetical protein OEZ86_014644 [Tetradesmus obliquus]|nr:hypothetical protein OEZ86_014644 [Tetradesmus obliquus]